MKKIFVIFSIFFLSTINFSEKSNGIEFEKKETEKEIHKEKKECPIKLNGNFLQRIVK
ncbi:hypothetical protein [Streptobacillus ratti]|uniref:hypothetical protein n=1 Tax=Streptobacillus ratti TaxID=1720557 RepID=UPI000B2AC4AA|nr:hypothetical protein [Streptobacillus ratti]